jgi:PAS domain S-box-containing protein
MTNLLSRLLLLIVVALVPAYVLDVVAADQSRGGAWLFALGAALAVAVALVGAQALIRRPVAHLLRMADRLRRGDHSARVGGRPDGSEFSRLGAALDAVAEAQERRETALREAAESAERARAALGESEARLRLALAAAEVGVFEIDLGRDQVCVWHDDRAAALTGGSLPAGIWVVQNDPRVRDLLRRIHPEDRPARRAALQAVIDGRAETLAITWRCLGANGTWRWVAERGGVVARAPRTGAPLRIVGVVRDVTEQHDRATALEREVAERTVALRESERRFRGIFDSAFQLTALLSHRGKVLEINRAWLDFLGLTEAEVVGRPICEIGDWAASPRTVAKMKDHVAAAAAGKFVRQEIAMQDSLGRPVSFDFSLKPIFDEGGAVTMVVAEARDITERAGLQAQLAQAQKMEAVGQLTGGVAHDFNNLLQALTGNLDLIRRHGEAHNDERLLHLVANAQRAAGRGARLTQQLLAFSRRQNLRPENVCASRLFAEMGELLRRAAGETVTVRTLASDDLWCCRLDPAQFESALLNLAINARDAMPDGGTLTVEATNLVLAAPEAARLEVPPGEYVRVDVSDTGTGIAPEHLSRLFEPFFTTKEVGKGTGLGLAMVHGFVRQSGGAVAVTSEPGRGTTVSLFLPRAEAPAETDEPLPPGVAPAPERHERLGILVVEDDPEVREAVQFALTDAGHRVLTAAEASEALAILRNGVQLDLLLCDVALPGGINGLEIADAARRQRPDLRILLASGYGPEGLEAGEGYEVMAKPFTQAELLRRVAQTRAAAPAD